MWIRTVWRSKVRKRQKKRWIIALPSIWRHFFSLVCEGSIRSCEWIRTCNHVYILPVSMTLTLFSSAVIQWLAAHKAYRPCEPLTQHVIRAEYPPLFTHTGSQTHPSPISGGGTRTTGQDGTETMPHTCQRPLWHAFTTPPSPQGCFSAIQVEFAVKRHQFDKKSGGQNNGPMRM